MAASKVAEMVNPTEQRTYPIELSPALRGLASKELFTAVRYNHKPTLSSDAAPSSAKIKPSPSSSNGAYDLSFTDAGGRYAYTGTRTTQDSNYVLVFDAAREVFVLHRVDSMFHMNLAKTPSDGSAASLRDKHPHLELPAPPAAAEPKPAKAKAAPRKAAPGSKSAAAAAGKKKAVVPAPLSLPPTPPPAVEPLAPPPPPPPAGKKKRRPAEEEEEEDSDSGDGGLLVVEYPGGKPPGSAAAVAVAVARTARPNDFSPAFPPPAMPMRRFSQFARGEGEEEEEEDDDEADADADADADNEFEAILEEEEEEQQQEEEEEDGEEDVQMGDFRLGSPLNGPGAGVGQAMEQEVDEDDIDLEAELEAEMEKELAESSVSEED